MTIQCKVTYKITKGNTYMAHIQIIIGSTRPARVGKKIADWYLSQIQSVSGNSYELVDLAEINLPFLNEPIPASHGVYSRPHTKEWAAVVAKADAYVWITPEYNHAPSPALLNAIDYLSGEWHYKPVAFVGYGTLGAARAIESLVSVASELRMVPLKERVWVNEPWVNVTEAGEIITSGGNPVGQIAELAKWADATKVLRTP